MQRESSSDSRSSRRGASGDSGENKEQLVRKLARLRRRAAKLEARRERDAEPTSVPTAPPPEDELRRSREKYESLVNTVDGIVWEGSPDTFQFTFVSPQAEHILGYPVDEWLSDPAFWVKHLHPDDRDWAMTFCYNATQDGRSHEFEYRMLAADGRTVWLRDIVTVMAEHGHPTILRGLMVDVTADRLSRLRKREEDRRFREQTAALVDLATSEALRRGDFRSFGRLATESVARTLDVERLSIWFFNTDRSILRCWDLFEASAGRHSEGTELRAASYPRYFAALERGRAVAANDACRDPDTSEFAEVYLNPLGITSMLDAPLRRAGEIIGVVCHEHVGTARRWALDEREFAASVADLVCLALETSERRKAERAVIAAREELFERQRGEKQLVEAELDRARNALVRRTRLSVIGQVAASIAHDLRNPLGAIRNAVYYLERRSPGEDPKWSEYLGIIETEVHTADRIIGNLLEMSRSKEPSKQRVDLGPALRDALERVEGTDDIRLELDLDPEPFTVRADPGQLRQVLGNLITNSKQAVPAPTTIRVTARRTEGTDRIVVTDDGPGIAPEHRDRIFEPLYTTKARGTGLGLAICRQIVERHGGEIDLLESAGGGAAFCIRLPGEDGS